MFLISTSTHVIFIFRPPTPFVYHFWSPPLSLLIIVIIGSFSTTLVTETPTFFFLSYPFRKSLCDPEPFPSICTYTHPLTESPTLTPTTMEGIFVSVPPVLVCDSPSSKLTQLWVLPMDYPFFFVSRCTLPFINPLSIFKYVVVIYPFSPSRLFLWTSGSKFCLMTGSSRLVSHPVSSEFVYRSSILLVESPVTNQGRIEEGPVPVSHDYHFFK